MERESFESEEVAKIMNDNFVNIKVDREERPDIDKVYMTFVQVSSNTILIIYRFTSDSDDTTLRQPPEGEAGLSQPGLLPPCTRYLEEPIFLLKATMADQALNRWDEPFRHKNSKFPEILDRNQQL